MLELDQDTVNLWLKKFDYSLPELLEVTKKETSNDVFLIGAAIFDIYQTQGWIDKFSRKTGDADFTIEYLGDPTEYRSICSNLIARGYRLDEVHPYRYHPEKKQGIYAYVDLLTFTVDKKEAENARRVMSVGDQFHFDGMDFAKIDPLKFTENIYLPNPLALIYLKLRSYFNTPERKKDFVDMLELVLRLVSENEILDKLKSAMQKNDDPKVLQDIRSMCFDIEEDRGGTFDLDDIEQDLQERLLDEYSFEDIPENVKFFRKSVL